MTSKIFSIATAGLVAALASSSASAEVKTWRFVGEVYGDSIGPTPPTSLIEIGKIITVDYEIEMATPVNPSIPWPLFFSNAVVSFTYDGEKSASWGDYFSGPPMNALNAYPLAPRHDGIDFLSFNNYDGTLQLSLANGLAELSMAMPSMARWHSDYRIDIGTNSVHVRPLSFTAVTAVPEPTQFSLTLGGLGIIMLGAKLAQQRGFKGKKPNTPVA